MLSRYVYTKDRVPHFSISKVKGWIDTQTDIQVDSTEIISYLHMQMVINMMCIFIYLLKLAFSIGILLMLENILDLSCDEHVDLKEQRPSQQSLL